MVHKGDVSHVHSTILVFISFTHDVIQAWCIKYRRDHYCWLVIQAAFDSVWTIPFLEAYLFRSKESSLDSSVMQLTASLISYLLAGLVDSNFTVSRPSESTYVKPVFFFPCTLCDSSILRFYMRFRISYHIDMLSYCHFFIAEVHVFKKIFRASMLADGVSAAQKVCSKRTEVWLCIADTNKITTSSCNERKTTGFLRNEN